MVSRNEACRLQGTMPRKQRNARILMTNVVHGISTLKQRFLKSRVELSEVVKTRRVVNNCQ